MVSLTYKANGSMFEEKSEKAYPNSEAARAENAEQAFDIDTPMPVD